MANNKLSDLRDHIFMALERLADEDMSNEKVQQEVEKAKAIAQLSATIIASAKVEIDYINAVGLVDSQSELFKSVNPKLLS
jgi:hypothetical protein